MARSGSGVWYSSSTCMGKTLLHSRRIPAAGRFPAPGRALVRYHGTRCRQRARTEGPLMPENNTPAPFVPQLTTRDWNEEWRLLQKTRRNADDAAYWNARSRTFATKDAPNPYVERFLELADVRPGETVFDMGC